MPIKLENVGIAVRDLEATIAFFTDRRQTATVASSSSSTSTPDAIETAPTRPNEVGMHRVAFSVDDIDEALEIAARHGCHPLRGVATYRDVYKLTYVRGPSGIIVMLAEELKKS
jgi:glyoxylase I family protein